MLDVIMYSSHGITEWFGLGRTLKIIHFQSPTMRGKYSTSIQEEVAKEMSKVVLNISRDGDVTSFLAKILFFNI